MQKDIDHRVVAVVINTTKNDSSSAEKRGHQ